MKRRIVYAEDYDPVVLDGMKKRAFAEEVAFRSRMKGLEEYALSGAVANPGASIAGMPVFVAHRMGDQFDVRVRDPFTKQLRTVVSHKYDLLGRRTGTTVAWAPGDPRSVAAAFGIPFVSAFGDLPKNKPQEVSDKEDIERASHDVQHRAAVAEAKAKARMSIIRKYSLWVGTPRESFIPAEYLEEAKKAKGGI